MKIGIATLACGVLLLGGCVPTTNPIYTQQDLVFDEEVLGKWVQRGGVEVEVSRKGRTQSYLVKYSTRKETVDFIGHVAEIGGVRLLDIHPNPVHAADAGIATLFHFVPIHTIYRIDQTSPKLELSGFDVDWCDRQIKDGGLASVQIGKRKLVSATTKELQEFLVKHKDRFNEPIVFTRP